MQAAAAAKLTVVRAAGYSPYSVAEHSVGLMLSLNRKIHKAYAKTRDLNFSLVGLTGFDVHGKTVGVIGAGRIGICVCNVRYILGLILIKNARFPYLHGYSSNSTRTKYRLESVMLLPIDLQRIRGECVVLQS
eukprot:SAG31_NODE_632_length_13389_cov_4.818360_3_plen_133_part_00